MVCDCKITLFSIIASKKNPIFAFNIIRKAMKHIVTLSILAAAMLLAACNNTPKPIEPTENNQTTETTVDWDMPLYELNAEGDTNTVWTYQDTEEGRTVIQLAEEEDSYYDRYEHQYDREGHLISMKVENGPWKVRTREVTYSIDSDMGIRVGEGEEHAEGDPEFYAVREESYFLDDTYLYDTLTFNYSAVVSWDELDPDGDGVQDVIPAPVWEDHTVQRTRYEQTASGMKPAEKWYYAGTDDQGNLILNARVEYAYDDEGRLSSETTHYQSGSQETKNYTYDGNVRTMKVAPYDAEIKTYYKIKDKR